MAETPKYDRGLVENKGTREQISKDLIENKQKIKYDTDTPEGKTKLSEEWMKRANLSEAQKDHIFKKLGFDKKPDIATKEGQKAFTEAVQKWQNDPAQNNNRGTIGKADGILGWATLEALDSDDKLAGITEKKSDNLAKNEKKINPNSLKILQEMAEEKKKVENKQTLPEKSGDAKSDPLLALGKDVKIGTKTTGDMKISEIANIDMNTIKDPKIVAQILAAKNRLGGDFPDNFKNLTVAQYASYRENPLLAASKLTPYDNGRLPLGFGEKGVKYMKGGSSNNNERVDHITFMYRGDKAPTVVTYDKDPEKPKEVTLSERFTKDGDYTLPDGSLLKVTRVTPDGSRKWFVYGKEEDNKPKWVLNEKGELEGAKRAV